MQIEKLIPTAMTSPLSCLISAAFENTLGLF
jgi:hypothetical protein